MAPRLACAAARARWMATSSLQSTWNASAARNSATVLTGLTWRGADGAARETDAFVNVSPGLPSRRRGVVRFEPARARRAVRRTHQREVEDA